MKKYIILPLNTKTYLRTLHRRLETIPKEYIPTGAKGKSPYKEFWLDKSDKPSIIKTIWTNPKRLTK
jgi:hypothetical protein